MLLSLIMMVFYPSDPIYATEDEFNDYDKEVAVNGCGPDYLIKHLPAWLVSWLLYFINGAFKPACAIHDIRYFIGGTEKDRKRIDKMFYKDMKAIVKNKVNFWMRWKHYFKAWRYYRYVRAFGKEAFNYKKLEFHDLPRFKKDINSKVDPKKYYWNDRTAEGLTSQWEMVNPL